MDSTDVVVIGAGQAGLSSAYFLRRAGFAAGSGYVVLDGDDGPGGAWRHRWPSLTLSKVHGLNELPGRPLGVTDVSRSASDVVSAYFAAYEREFELPVHRPAAVTAVRDGGDGRLVVESSAGTWSARAVVNATGTWTRPFWPYYPGMAGFRGRQLHTADYRGPEEFAGRRVVVVGGGTSAVQLLTEIAEVADTTWVTRRPPVFREGPFSHEIGRAAVAMVERRVREGKPPASVVSVTGLQLTPEVRDAMARGVLARLPMFDRITPDGVAWDDGRTVSADVILWCTGFRAAVDHLAPLGLREPGGGIRVIGTRAANEPRLHLVGYGPSASTIGASRAGRAAVREIRELLAVAPVG
ncbi:NAD(P)/FAD-dependent oxidoreductase [Solihabitans fulvus]|uniref:NAD(P)/FAD-dependent oxidoreductase n=1 Tax=Solihabitans fulvus TaxID=1892852 RepID=A0A5B2XEH1_9PSEU|nr:NAD(P)-binding domain-containing protein [Solihabitans fulvus]KAA2261172.1 NAD(P)/FAD-dependent oxidoreductase [Solihabitans fulvus]